MGGGRGWGQRAKPERLMTFAILRSDRNYKNIDEKRMLSLKQQELLELRDMEKGAKILL